jgi:hypothetical protein
MFPCSAEAQVTIDRARQVHAWFLAGQIDQIWALRSPEAVGSMTTRESLVNSQQRFLNQYGPLQRFVTDETRPPYNGQTFYTNFGVYQHYEGQVHVTWGYDQQGLITSCVYPHYVTATTRRQTSPSGASFLLSMIAVLIGAVLLVGLIIGGTLFMIFGLLRYRGNRWAAAAKALGLELEPRQSTPSIHQQMVGRRGDLQIVVGIRVEHHGSGKNRSVVYFTYAKALFSAPLQSGTFVSTSGFSDKIFAAVGLNEDLKIGDEAIDSAYMIRTLDQEFTRALLTEPRVREGMLGYSRGAWRPKLDDGSIRLERQRLEFDPKTLSRQIAGVVELAQRIETARKTLAPPAQERILRTSWTAVANRHNLSLDVHTGVMRGRFGGSEVSVEAVLHRGLFWTVFRVTFDRPLGVSLSLTREGALTGIVKLLGAQDIQTGDPQFDAAFVIKGSPEERVRSLLSADVRALLLEVNHDATQLVVKDDDLVAEVKWMVTEAPHLESSLNLVTRIAAALARVNQGGAGPYRV